MARLAEISGFAFSVEHLPILCICLMFKLQGAISAYYSEAVHLVDKVFHYSNIDIPTLYLS